MSEMVSNRRAALGFVLTTVFLETVGFGFVIPVLPDLLVELGGQDLSQAAVDGGWMISIYALMAFFFAPVMGNLSDRYGRRPVLLIALTALSIDYLLLANAASVAGFVGVSGITVLLIGRAIAGAAGSTAVTANAFIADVTEPDERARYFGLIGAAWGLGFIVGPALGGVIMAQFGLYAPFYAAAGLVIVTLIAGVIVLPETLSPDNRRAFVLWRSNPVGSLMVMSKNPMVLGLLIAFVFFQFAHDANPSVWAYYAREKFGWGGQAVGLSMAFVGICMVIVMSLVLPFALKRYSEPQVAIFGLIMMVIGFAGFAAAPNEWVMVAMIIPFSLIGLVNPALKAIISRTLPSNQQGEMQGAITSVMSLTMIVAPLVMTRTFNLFTGDDAITYLPGAPYWLAAGLSVITLMIVVGVLTRTRYERTV